MTVRRLAGVIAAVLVLVAGVPPPAVAAPPQFLPDIGYKYYYSRDLVFVDFVNPYFSPVNNVVVNMIVREGTGRNKVIAIGQTRMPPNLILMPGEHTSARVPIRARIQRDIPVNAQFEFRISGRVVPDAEVPPQVTVQGGTMEVNKDHNGVPYIFGFAQLDPLAADDAQVTVQMAILTFYDSQHRISWSEIMAINGSLVPGDSLMLFGKYEAAAAIDTSSVDVLFVALPSNRR